jgi:hypothetical protein
MELVLRRARQEAERRFVEAQGIEHVQNVVSEGIGDTLGAWTGIAATIGLAQHHARRSWSPGAGQNSGRSRSRMTK